MQYLRERLVPNSSELGGLAVSWKTKFYAASLARHGWRLFFDSKRIFPQSAIPQGIALFQKTSLGIKALRDHRASNGNSGLKQSVSDCSWQLVREITNELLFSLLTDVESAQSSATLLSTSCNGIVE
jgi:hypothetical protein